MMLRLKDRKFIKYLNLNLKMYRIQDNGYN